MGRTVGSGRGSIYKRGDKWRGQITVNGRRLSHTAKKKADVIKWMDDIKNGPIIERQNITLEAFAEKWLERKSRTLAPQSIYSARMAFRKWMYPELGKYKIQDITVDMLTEMYDRMYDTGYSDGSIKTFKANLNQLLDYAVDENIIAVNPHRRVVVKKRREVKKVDAYTAEDNAKIVKYLKEHLSTQNILFYLLISTGMRVGEACALQWTDIDLHERTVNINKTVVWDTGRFVIQPHTKTDSSMRVIYLSKTVCNVLSDYHPGGKSGYVFLNSLGNPWTHKTLRKYWIRVCAEIDIEYKNIHSLRHTFATRALEKGIDIKTISTILGHKNVVTTMNIYQDVFSSQKIKAADAMNDLY